MSKIEIERLPLSAIDINDGQIDGVSKNPRWWSYEDVEKLKKSIVETPELLDARGIIVYPHGGRYVAIGGNLRLVALRSLGKEDAPCIVLPEETTAEKLREIVIKDNGSFGGWDETMLHNEWGDCPLDQWGIEIFPAQDTADEKAVREKDDREVFSVTFGVMEFNHVAAALREIDDSKEAALLQLIEDGE